MAVTGLAGAGVAQEAPPVSTRAPALGAASNFGQGWTPEIFDAALTLPVTDFRDAVYWSAVLDDGRYDFSAARTRFPDLLAARGAEMSLTVNNGHPDYDGDETPHSAEGVAAFAGFAADMVRRFSAIRRVEIGNEMNSDTFVSGPMRGAEMGPRADLYLALLEASARAVRAADPGVRILGGAVHSIPLAWIAALLERGAAAHMDALALHPYTTPAEQLRRQIALLRGLPGATNLPIEVTEFGTRETAGAPAHLLRNYCQMALSGVERAVWYPLSPRGDGFAGLLDEAGAITPLGRVYRRIGAEFAGRPVRDVAPDPFTYACLFDERHLLIWGAPRALALAEGLIAVAADGTPLATAELHLSRDEPLLISAPASAQPLRLGRDVTLGPQAVLADSFDQFAYPGHPGPDPFERLLEIDGELHPLELRPGQEKGGVPWMPYLGTSRDGLLRAGADWVLPSAWDDRPLRVVHRYVAPEEQRADLVLAIDPAERSADGISLRVTLDGAELDSRTVTGAERIVLRDLVLSRGAVLSVAVGPGQSAKGDVTRFRMTLLRPDQS